MHGNDKEVGKIKDIIYFDKYNGFEHYYEKFNQKILMILVKHYMPDAPSYYNLEYSIIGSFPEEIINDIKIGHRIEWDYATILLPSIFNSDYTDYVKLSSQVETPDGKHYYKFKLMSLMGLNQY